MKAKLVNKTSTPFCVQGVLLRPYHGVVTEIPDNFKYDKKLLAVLPVIENKVEDVSEKVTEKVIEKSHIKSTTRKNTNKKRKRTQTKDK